MINRRASIALAATLAVTAIPGTAFAAKGGGGGGGGTTTPPPAGPAVECDYSLDGPVDGGTVFSNQVGVAGCVSVLNRGSSLSLYGVTVSPGWTYTVAGGGGTSSRIAIDFSNPSTGQKAEARIEFGKTVIK